MALESRCRRRLSPNSQQVARKGKPVRNRPSKRRRRHSPRHLVCRCIFHPKTQTVSPCHHAQSPQDRPLLRKVAQENRCRRLLCNGSLMAAWIRMHRRHIQARRCRQERWLKPWACLWKSQATLRRTQRRSQDRTCRHRVPPFRTQSSSDLLMGRQRRRRDKSHGDLSCLRPRHLLKLLGCRWRIRPAANPHRKVVLVVRASHCRMPLLAG
mmetsp:Transcript_17411/g.49144  ORF Transcript_17411/g.49144 Transcript_17411/m.49144 type:complete len:211 (-) Transcript_17411:3194-3826(-)